MGNARVKWGILSTARIGIEKVIPAMQKGGNIDIVGISSRDLTKAQQAARVLAIPKTYGSYEEMVCDPEIEAIYIPLPNHLHFEWTKKAIENGNHVLCEKPMTLRSKEILELIQLRNEFKVKVGEGFMVHTHPQWIDVVHRIKSGELGLLKTIQGFFSYFKTDPYNIRNIYEYGGGAMWDIGCYPIHISRYAFNEEPKRVFSLVDRDPVLKIDRLGSVILDFPSGQSIFTVSTQLVPHQRMHFYGERKKIEVEIPFNAPNDRECKISLYGGDLFGKDKQEVLFDICDQYTIQGERFSNSILNNEEVPVPLENALGNIRIIEAIFESEKTGSWVTI